MEKLVLKYQVILKLLFLRLKFFIVKSTYNPKVSFQFRKIIACTIITTFLTLIIILILRLFGYYLTTQTILPQMASLNPSTIPSNTLHRYVKIALYLVFFTYAFITNFHLKFWGNLILFFGTLFYFIYFGSVSYIFLHNLSQEISLIQNYPDPAYSNINYFHYQVYCNTKNKKWFYICEPSLVCQSQYYQCLYGCQARCAPKIRSPLIPTPGHFKIVQYN